MVAWAWRQSHGFECYPVVFPSSCCCDCFAWRGQTCVQEPLLRIGDSFTLNILEDGDA